MKYPFVTVVDASRDERQCYIHFSHQQPQIALSLVQFGHHITRSSYGYGPMIRDHYLIHFVKRGSGVVQTDKQEYGIEQNQCFAFFPHQTGYYQADEEAPWEYYWLGFEGFWAEDLMARMGFSPENTILQVPEADTVFSILEDMAQRDMTADNALFFSGAMQQVLSIFAGETAMPPARVTARNRIGGNLGNHYVGMIQSIIDNSYAERIRVDALAGQMGYHRSYLSSLFKKHTGLSIKQYLLNVRMQQAIIRLQMPAYTVEQVALECGFPDAMYFSRLFKERFGMSPSKYATANSPKTESI